MDSLQWGRGVGISFPPSRQAWVTHWSQGRAWRVLEGQGQGGMCMYVMDAHPTLRKPPFPALRWREEA